MQKYLPVLRNCPFFTGLTDDEILSILHCVSAAKITRPRGSYIFRAGDPTEVMGLMLSGSTLVIQEDLWGHRNILSKCSTGDFFGEPYAATPGFHPEHQRSGGRGLRDPAAERQAAAHLLPLPPATITRSSSAIWSAFWQTNTAFNDKITHVSKRTTREKLLSYLSAESIRQSSLSFDIPFDRQQLADFLCVERAAMSVELSKLQKEGLLVTKRNHFELLTR